MAKSPYLSDRVLLAAINEKPSPLPPGHIKEIVITNSPVTSNVKTAIDSLTLPPGIRSLINAAQTGISERALLESETEVLQGYAQLIENEIVSLNMQNGTFNDAIVFLEQSSSLASKKLLSELYLANGNFTESRNTINQIALQPDAESQNYASMSNILIDLGEDNKTINEMNAAQEQTIRDVANSSTLISASAQAMLTIAKQEEYDHPIAKFVSARKSHHHENETSFDKITISKSDDGFYFNIYPNPNDGSMRIDYQLGSNGRDGELVIYDITGRRLRSFVMNNNRNSLQINEHELSVGIYYYNILIGTQIVISDKLVIIR